MRYFQEWLLRSRRSALVLMAFVALQSMGFHPDARAADILSDDQKAVIQNIVRDYILAHPEVVTQALQEEQSDQARNAVASHQATIILDRKELLDDPSTPMIGNPQGSTTMVEFADYQCAYCRAMEPIDQKLIAENPKLRIVMKDLPILGPVSEYAARVGLVAAKQGKYAQYRSLLMAQPAPLDTQKVWLAASAAGLNIGAAMKEIKLPWVDTELAEDAKLADALAIDGTPAFIIGNALIIGGVPQSNLEDSLRRIGD